MQLFDSCMVIVLDEFGRFEGLTHVVLLGEYSKLAAAPLLGLGVPRHVAGLRNAPYSEY